MSLPRLSLGVVSMAISALAVTAIAPAVAAERGFPEPGVTFTIRTDAGEGIKCVAHSGSGFFADLRLRTCNERDRNQQFVVKARDEEGYSAIYGVDGGCMTSTPTMLGPEDCKNRGKNDRWKQDAQGRIENRKLNSHYWGIVGSGERALIRGGYVKSNAATFNVVLVSQP